ncbi:MAG: branched-chain amino acid ABC transporter permease [Vulcanimicrobiaceae bacterium]
MIRPATERPLVTLAGIAIAFVVLPLFMPGGTFDLYPFAGARLPVHAGFVDLATTVLFFGLFALGFNLLFGHTGELSFGHAMFFALAAYGTALFTKGFDLTVGGAHLAFGGSHNALLALVVALSIVALWAWGLARIIVPRSSGIYYSMITLAFAQVIFFIAFRWSDLTGGEDGLQGIARPEIPGIPPGWFGDATHVYVFTAFVAFLAVAANYWIVHSKFGSVLHAIRENKQRARSLRYDVDKYRVTAFVLSALFPGVAGWLWVYFQQSINPDAGSIDYSGRVVMMSLLGGINTFVGPMIGAFVYWDLQNRVAGLSKYWPATIGIVFAFFVIVAPRGIGGGFEELRRYGIQSVFRRLFSRRARLEADLAEERAAAAATGHEVAP